MHPLEILKPSQNISDYVLQASWQRYRRFYPGLAFLAMNYPNRFS